MAKSKLSVAPPKVRGLKQNTNQTPATMVPFVCGTCGQPGYYSLRKKVRRFCNETCYENRPNVSLGSAIVRRLGGATLLSDYLGLTRLTVAKWGTRGIPRRYHSELLKLAVQLKMDKLITVDMLLQSVLMAPAYKAGLVGRKASTMPPSPSTLRRRAIAARAKEGG